jgi:hypothetical protein
MEMLTLLGYDTKSEVPIYQQFEIKHQLWHNTKKIYSM